MTTRKWTGLWSSTTNILGILRDEGNVYDIGFWYLSTVHHDRDKKLCWMNIKKVNQQIRALRYWFNKCKQILLTQPDS